MRTRPWKTWIVSAVVSASVAAGAVAVTSQDSGAVSTSTSASSSATTSTTNDVTQASDTTTTATASPSTAALEAILTDSRFAVSVLDVDTGEALAYGDTGTFDTASIVKVDILAALLWQHQQDGTTLTSSEQALATAMIERSDNDAATTLFGAVGGEAGLEAFDDLIGLTSTDIGSNGDWGLTQTTPDDQVRLLQVVLGDGAVLTPASKAYAESLMSSVIDAQNFGVSAAADDADDAALKVGYLQRSATGLWDVTSIGRVEAGGHTYLVAVLTDGSTGYAAGVSLADEVARAAVSSMTAA